MAKLIKDRSLVNDDWVWLREITDAEEVLQDERDLILPLPFWLAHREQLCARAGRKAVWLDSHELPELLGDDVQGFDLIALHFPVFSDGRPYSSARELRQRLAFQGELRAVGDVLRDQLFYMSRCGFDAFALREDQNPDYALTAFDDFREGYQSSVDRPTPLFRRRG